LAVFPFLTRAAIVESRSARRTPQKVKSPSFEWRWRWREIGVCNRRGVQG